MASLKDRLYFFILRPGTFPVRLFSFRLTFDPPSKDYTWGVDFEIAILSFGFAAGVDVFWDGE